jgi:hypothetical protein
VQIPTTSMNCAVRREDDRKPICPTGLARPKNLASPRDFPRTFYLGGRLSRAITHQSIEKPGEWREIPGYEGIYRELASPRDFANRSYLIVFHSKTKSFSFLCTAACTNRLVDSRGQVSGAMRGSALCSRHDPQISLCSSRGRKPPGSRRSGSPGETGEIGRSRYP